MVDTLRSQAYPQDMLRSANQPAGEGYLESMATDLVDSVTQYAREKPTSALLWAVGIGFVLGWKLKPW